MKKPKKRMTITVRVVPDGATITVTGRDAWALDNLIRAGEAGVTPLETPGPRWSAYVFDLKATGLDIQTLHENHGGDFPGSHARYVLRSPVEVVKPLGEAA